MKKSKLLCGVMMLAGLAISSSAMADRWGHEHVGVGVYFGAPYHPYYPYGPYPYYPYPYPYAYAPPPQVVVVPQQPPPTYIEQPQSSVAPAAPGPQASNSWYHCDKPEGYYPYIKECPGGWKAVAPSPAPEK
ncbi:MAG TPA: hypothetical protein VIE17_06575 [Methylophilaceae bacterium]|jgi:hypothetical protein